MNESLNEPHRPLPFDMQTLALHLDQTTDNSNPLNLDANNTNNNNNNDIFSVQNKVVTAVDAQLKSINDRLSNSSPHATSSNSSQSSQAQHVDDCHPAETNTSSPGSPQSSYNSSYGSNSGRKLSSSSGITALVPGGVVTTQNISTVIRPKGNNNSLQFVKIQTPDLSKKAVEQIRMAEETKISKEKEVEEEWQNNFLNWRSKRLQRIPNLTEYDANSQSDNSDTGPGRKIKTFAEMVEQREKSGNRLGFNPLRYIASDDGENEVEAPTSHHIPRESSDQEFEEHSTASSSLNHRDSKSPCFSNQVLKKEEDNFSCDSNSMFHTDNKDLSSISVVQRSDTEHLLNSTLKQGIKTPPTKNGKSHVVFEIDSRTSEVNRSEEDSDNSCLEEDEEEEQKHLQRIAFEAKLKAFEKLAKPAESKKPFIRPRITETTKQVDTSNLLESQKHAGAMKLTDARIYPDHQRQSELKRQAEVQKLAELKQQADLLRQVEQQRQLEANKLVERQAELKRLAAAQKLAEEQKFIEAQRLAEAQAQAEAEILLEERKQLELRKKSPPNDVVDMLNTKNSLSPSLNGGNHKLDCNNIPLPELQKKEVPSVTPKKSSREEKDKTVLSVSGKKRCSSCREELGRGAAAFVVESLSLAYHTNCFRCSVCHVNLSNGFRGVDVRVHAGALHCQNCYSKDGLNYSRV